MNNLYRRLAWNNIKNGKHFYLPYLLAGMISAMMYYSIRTMQGNEGLHEMRGGSNLEEILKFGTWVIAIFVCIFLFYTNSFLMKRRKKELGIYNILGMEKRHIVKIMFWETLFSWFVTVCILRSSADSDAFQSGRCAEHNGRPETPIIVS